MIVSLLSSADRSYSVFPYFKNSKNISLFFVFVCAYPLVVVILALIPSITPVFSTTRYAP